MVVCNWDTDTRLLASGSLLLIAPQRPSGSAGVGGRKGRKRKKTSVHI